MSASAPHHRHRGFLVSVCVGLVTLAIGSTLAGCSPFKRQNSDDSLKSLMKAPASPDTIGQAAIPYGMTYARIHGVGLVKELARTGAPPMPSELRDRLVAEMRTHDVQDPDRYLESNQTALVITEAILPPGVKRGDRVDIRVSTPTRSEVTSLHNGFLMPARLQEMRRLQGAMRTSDVATIGTGPLLVPGIYLGNGEERLREAQVLAGGTVQVDRPVGLVLRPEYEHVLMSKKFGEAINDRFYFFDGSTRRGIATPKEDDFIQVEVLPRYRDNVHRLLAVVRSIPLKRPEGGLREQLGELAKQLEEPTTAAEAALTLEAIGDDAVGVLTDALKTENDEIRFYVAEALAYLDRTEAIEPLADLIVRESAFRYPALVALQGMPQPAAAETLQRLLDESNNEVRYGSFVALRKRDDAPASVRGRKFQDGYHVHQLPTRAEPLVAVSVARRAEIVIFGSSLPVNLQEPVITRGGIVLRPEPDGRIKISRFRPDQPDRRVSVSAKLTAVLTGMGTTEASYADCIDVLRTLKEEDAIDARLAIDPMPRPLRTYYRDGDDEGKGKGASDGDQDAVGSSLAPQDIPEAKEEQVSWLQRMQWW